jgi:hypothetical protein
MKTSQILIGLLLISCVLTAAVYRPNDPNKKENEFCLRGDNDDNYTDCIHCRSGKSNYGKNIDEAAK